ncbi:hybrid sensor histidine kinase/response regulator [Ruegeria aquimaris]|uniref:histidine kinase n=1 Tax=Ruegeria aquimaris TaxID=2984333 RepID=A0ABT3AG18_9RHOB|nr:PAS domain-containing hybrid sensor histidine kinase/response regulator [Ruegeria sp. XHP0148]MCV2887507.1 ATP-binding protein [Ruegeria sp. XHP0148]
MQDTGSHEADQLAEFERRYSRRGLLIRYARGRVRNFGNRQIMTFSGGLALTMSEGPETGAIAVLVALFGELVDCLFLSRLPKLIEAGHDLHRLLFISSITALVQSATIALCVLLAWFGEFSGQSSLFTIAFLAGAAINAGLVLPFNPSAGAVRLTVYALVTLFIFAFEVLTANRLDSIFLMDASGTAMLAFMVALFLNFVNAGFNTHRRTTLRLIEQGRDLLRHQKEAQQLSLVARNANDSVIMSDATGRIVWTNEAFTRITGFSADEARDKLPGELLNGPETDLSMSNAIAAAITEGRPFRGEIQNVTKQGQPIWMDVNMVPIVDETGNVEMTVAVERDITQAKSHEQELAAAREAAEDGARAKADFLATMSHEIRTPMNGVVGMAELLSGTPLTKEQNEYVDTIKSSAAALLTIINDVLELSRLDAHKVELHPVDFDLLACVSDTVRLIRPQANSKGLRLSLETLTEVPELVHADDGRLRQILINLLGNAVKFTENGAVYLRLSVEQAASGHVAIIEVEDTGIGIPADKIEHVFERFSQAEANTTRTYGGTGLGLSISRELVGLMGGSLTVDSTLGSGSCFSLRLPLAPPMQIGGTDQQMKIEDEVLERLDGRTVLVADDNRVNRLLIAKFLADLPVRLEFACDGQQVVEMTEALNPDIVFMDMSMPQLSGIEATRLIRKSWSTGLPIVALTANAYDSDRRACLDAGMNDFLSKPVGRSELISCLLKHLAHRTDPDSVPRTA